MTTFRLPDLGEGLREAEIVSWQVSEGDHVVADQPLVSVETEKAVVEIPSPQSGRVTKLHGQPGDIVLVGHPLVEYDGGDKQQSETVVGELPHGEPQTTATAHASADGRPKAAPAVRKLAREQGVDLASVVGSGVDGTIVLEDVRPLPRQEMEPPSENAYVVRAVPWRGQCRTPVPKLCRQP